MLKDKKQDDFISRYLLKYPAHIMACIKNNQSFGSRIARQQNYTLTCSTKTLDLLEKAKLIVKTKEGRVNILSLTTKGERVQELLLKIKEVESKLKSSVGE